jgi:hypothetical protein
MSKKKNTLQDLDDFLKQQAATLVTPDTLTKTEAQPEKVQDKTPQKEVLSTRAENLITDFPVEDPAFRKKLYDFIITSLEAQQESLPEDKMLINTALYLKGGNNWKNVIREYWKQK